MNKVKATVGYYTESNSKKEYFVGHTDGGYCFKDEKAFKSKKGVCYIEESEFSTIDSACYDGYTYSAFLLIAKNDPKVAKLLFDEVDWQGPEMLLDDMFNSNELYYCDKCKKFTTTRGDSISKCPKCGK